MVYSNTNNLIGPGTTLTLEAQLLLPGQDSCTGHPLLGQILLYIRSPQHHRNHCPLPEGPSAAKCISQCTHLLEREAHWCLTPSLLRGPAGDPTTKRTPFLV